MTARLLTVADVAERLQVSRSTAYAWLESGRIETVRLGASRGPVRVREEAIEAFIRSRIQPPVRQLTPARGAVA